MTAIKDGVF